MRWIVKWAIGILRRSDLTIAERTAIIGEALDKLEALPIKGVIQNTEEGLLINGKQVDMEKMRNLRESAKAALDNQAFNLIGEEVVWLAIQRGIHNADTPEKLYFYRAAIWFSEQMKVHLQTLAGTIEPPL